MMNNRHKITSKEGQSFLVTKAHYDLTIRARGGMLIYLSVWLIVSFWGDMPTVAPTFFYINTSIFIVLALIRLAHYVLIKNRPEFNNQTVYHLLLKLILFGGLHWGITAAWIIFGSTFTQLYYPMIIITAVFAISGTIALSISKSVSIYYPIVVLGPSLFFGLFVDNVELQILSILAIFAILYALEASRAAHNDYFSAITNQLILEERALFMEVQSETDSLTGLKNRMFFNQQFPLAWAHGQRSQTPLSILMIDLDYFKNINDTYGHLAGDECLKSVAELLKSKILRQTDTVCRYGGEEFVILLPETNETHATQIASQIRASIEALACFHKEQKIAVTSSIGIASMTPQKEMDSESILKAADDALYQAKAMGRNQYQIAKNL